MGMFDYFKNLESSEKTKVDLFVCAAGHKCTEFQTKSLGCNMDSYYLLRNQLYKLDRSDPEEVVSNVSDDSITLSKLSKAVAIKITDNISIHAVCKECDPVYTETDFTSSYMSLMGHQPWIEYDLTFGNGSLKAIIPVRVESRDEVRKKLAKAGAIALPDDDRLVKRTLEQRKQRRDWDSI